MKPAIFALSFLLVWMADVHPQPVFYQGKTIKIVVGVPAGDVYNLWSRLIAAHMGKHIPGRPEFIVQNMPGAGSMIAANYVYGVAKPDGLTLGVFLPSLYFEQLLGHKEVQFDWAKYAWIDSPVRTERQMYMHTWNSKHRCSRWGFLVPGMVLIASLFCPFAVLHTNL